MLIYLNIFIFPLSFKFFIIITIIGKINNPKKPNNLTPIKIQINIISGCNPICSPTIFGSSIFLTIVIST